mgnify:FL=1
MVLALGALLHCYISLALVTSEQLFDYFLARLVGGSPFRFVWFECYRFFEGLACHPILHDSCVLHKLFLPLIQSLHPTLVFFLDDIPP